MQKIEVALAGFDTNNVLNIESYLRSVLANLIPGIQIEVAFTFVNNFFELDSLDTNFIVADKEAYENATLPLNGLEVYLISQNDFESANGSPIPASLHLLSQAILSILKENPDNSKEFHPKVGNDPDVNSNPQFLTEIMNEIQRTLRKNNIQHIHIENHVRGLIRQLSLNYSGWTLSFLMTSQDSDEVLEEKIAVPELQENEIAIPPTNPNETAKLTRLEVFIAKIGIWIVTLHKKGYAFQLQLIAPAS